jgi:hypothetical protein
MSRLWLCGSYSILVRRSRLFAATTTVLASGSPSSTVAPE